VFFFFLLNLSVKPMDPKRPNAKVLGVKDSIRSYTTLSEYIVAKQRYTRAKNRLNRYCSQNRVSYKEIRSWFTKPATWLSFVDKSRRFQNVREELLVQLKVKPLIPSLELKVPVIQQKEDHPLALSEPETRRYAACRERRVIMELENRVSYHESEVFRLSKEVKAGNARLNREISELKSERVKLLKDFTDQSDRLNRSLDELASLNEIKAQDGALRSLNGILESTVSSLRQELTNSKQECEALHRALEYRREIPVKQVKTSDASTQTDSVKPKTVSKKDNPSIEEQLKAARVSAAHSKSEVKEVKPLVVSTIRLDNLLKGIDWRTIRNFKFRAYQDAAPGTQENIVFNRYISLANETSTYTDLLIRKGILGEYFVKDLTNGFLT